MDGKHIKSINKAEIPRKNQLLKLKYINTDNQSHPISNNISNL